MVWNLLLFRLDWGCKVLQLTFLHLVFDRWCYQIIYKCYQSILILCLINFNYIGQQNFNNSLVACRELNLWNEKLHKIYLLLVNVIKFLKCEHLSLKTKIKHVSLHFFKFLYPGWYKLWLQDYIKKEAQLRNFCVFVKIKKKS